MNCKATVLSVMIHGCEYCKIKVVDIQNIFKHLHTGVKKN